MTSVVSKAAILAFSGHLWYNMHMEASIFNQSVSNVTHGRGYVYLLQYHIVWCTKYRKQVFQDGLEEEVKAFLKKTAESIDIKIDAMEVMPDHIHLLVRCKPQCRLSDAIKILKGNIARWLFLKHPELKAALWGGHLWNPSYFVVTVSDRNAEQVRDYILEQKKR